MDKAAAFTLIEIAICLAIIGFALIAIIGVLPIGLNTQRDNRQETIINQDATMLLEALRNGSRGADDLTNYVYNITNNWQRFDNQGNPSGGPHVNTYTYTAATVDGTAVPALALTNGANIIGLLSTPEFTQNVYPYQPINSLYNTFYISNHVSAYIRSLSGLAAEKPPQDNPIMQADMFSYRLFCVNAPLAVGTNDFNNSLYSRKLTGQLRELRLTFRWPILPNGNVGNNGSSPLTFRSSIAGQMTLSNNSGQILYFFHSQSFTNAP